MKVFCRYAVVVNKDKTILACGEKVKNVSKLLFIGRFRSWFRKVYMFVRDEKINGVLCNVVYWANAPKKQIGRLVFREGRELGMR